MFNSTPDPRVPGPRLFATPGGFVVGFQEAQHEVYQCPFHAFI